MESVTSETAEATYDINKGATFWFTGLSGSGKSTLSTQVKVQLDKMLGDTSKCFILDGDVIRRNLSKDLDYNTPEHTAENNRRISEVAKLFALSGQICLVAVISPCAKYRQFCR